MENLKLTIKNLRQANGFTHKTFAERLHMARSTYSKIESGQTELNITTIKSIANALNIPVTSLIKELDASFSNELAEMLYETEMMIYNRHVRGIPYEYLTDEHQTLLLAKGLSSREVYEKTPWGGRIYDFSPDDVIPFMFDECAMDILFKRNLITDEYWINQWKKYLSDENDHAAPRYEDDPNWKPQPKKIVIDDADYCLSFIFRLDLTNDKEKWIELADRDFPNGTDETGALEYLINNFGAVGGEIMSFTYCGYHSMREL